MKKLLAALFCLCCFLGCKSVPSPDDIRADITPAELIQLAQTSYDDGNTPAAEVYYNVLAERYSDDLSVRVVAEYEIGHIKVKQKRWDEAASLLGGVISYYESADAYALPSEYKKLATLDMAKIPEKYLSATEN
jgi:outer membrane protein assembly factor BamD (BamD/ComL family)